MIYEGTKVLIMKKYLKIIQKTRKNHKCLQCHKDIEKSSSAWVLVRKDEEDKDFSWFHNKECYDNFEAERSI